MRNESDYFWWDSFVWMHHQPILIFLDRFELELQPPDVCYLERRRRRSTRTVTVIVNAMTIVAVIPKVICTIWAPPFRPVMAGSGRNPGPVSFWTPKRPESNTSGNQMLTRGAGISVPILSFARVPGFRRPSLVDRQRSVAEPRSTVGRARECPEAVPKRDRPQWCRPPRPRPLSTARRCDLRRRPPAVSRSAPSPS